MDTYREPARDIPIIATHDVVVCGAGPAGCAAAIGAARHGADTLLVESTNACGGAVATQLVGVVLSTNGVDFQGIWHEWARKLKERHAITRLGRSHSHYYTGILDWYRASVDPEMVKWAWESLLDSTGAEVLFGAHACGVMREGDTVTGVIVETRAGRCGVRAARAIDATGDAAVCAAAGVPWDRGVAGKPWPQAVSLNAQWGWVSSYPEELPEGLRDATPGTLARRPEQLRRRDLKRVDPLDPKDITRAIRTLRKELWADAEDLPDDRYLVATAPDLGVRTSRIIQGMDRVTDDDAWEYRKRADGIARSSWELDVHEPDDEPMPPHFYHSRSAEYTERTKRTATGEWFDIPYGALIPAGIDNLLAAGRIVSSGYHAQGSLRIQQTCMATGQAAGVAAALSLRDGIVPRRLVVDNLVDQLSKDRDVAPAFPSLAG